MLKRPSTVRPTASVRGVGGRLYRALLALLKKQGYYTAFALVTGSNRQSNDFHRALGFQKMATERRTEHKFGQWLDLDYWRLPCRMVRANPSR